MLRTRLLVGSLLVLAMGGVLVCDWYFRPVFPLLAFAVLCVGAVGAEELRQLLPEAIRPRRTVAHFGTLLVLVANWYWACAPKGWPPVRSGWEPVMFAFAAVLLAAFLVEIFDYDGTGRGTARVASTAFVVGYVGLLGSFLVRLRWLEADIAGLMLTAAIFVPKVGDIGAYFAGRFLGRHLMAPRLSPKKTWEGLAGGLLFASLTAVAASFLGPAFPFGIGEAVAFGVVVGLAGVLGDLAESMMKRDAGAKDAAKSVPGFGGLLDVIDSVLFAAPVAYLWFRLR